MKVHPVANLFPMFSEVELQTLADDIKANGLHHPIVRQNGLLLDGRNRLAACELAGIKPAFTDYGGESPVAFIIGANLQRRHLSIGQKVALAVEIEPFFAEVAEKRLHLAKGRGIKAVEKVPQVKSRDQAAAAVGLSGKTVSKAKAIKAASRKLFNLVRQGKISR